MEVLFLLFGIIGYFGVLSWAIVSEPPPLYPRTPTCKEIRDQTVGSFKGIEEEV